MIEYHGRKQMELFVAHKDHTLAYCLKGDFLFLQVIRLLYFCSESDLFNRKFNEQEGVSFLVKYIANREFWLDALLVTEIVEKKTMDVIQLLKTVMLIFLKLSRSIDIGQRRDELVQFNKICQAEKQKELVTLSSVVLLQISSRRQKVSLLNTNSFMVEEVEDFIKTAANVIRLKEADKKLVLCDGVYGPVSLIDLKSNISNCTFVIWARKWGVVFWHTINLSSTQ